MELVRDQGAGGAPEEEVLSEEVLSEEEALPEEEDLPPEEGEQEKPPGSPVLRVIGRILLVLLLAAAAFAAVFLACPLKTVYVEGNTFYSSDEIANRILADGWPVITHNTVFLTIRRLFPGSSEIPFVESVRVTPVGTDAVRMTVEEKELAGYIPYSGRNLYFAGDGRVQEISPYTVRGITYVGGLNIREADKGALIVPEEKNDLRLVLEALRTLDKYDLHAESLRVTDKGAVDIYLGEIQVKLGKSDYDLKISRLALIYSYLPDRSGLIDLTNFSAADENIVLQ